MIALLVGLAYAAPTGADLSAWSVTAVEVLPDAYGKTGARAVERLGADVDLGEGWNLRIDGGLRVLRAPGAPLQGDLYSLAATHRGDLHKMAFGRIVRLDVRGFERIDGASLDLDTPGVFGASLWGGRLWHPEVWDPLGTVVAGAQFHVRTGSFGTSRTRVDGGYEARVSEGLYRQRIHLASTTLFPKGARLLAFAEIEPTADDLDSRASFQAALPVGRTVDLGFDARWEDLAPDHAGTVRTPMDWLSPQGYSLASARVRWFRGPWDVAVQTGGTLRAGNALEYGGFARGGAGLEMGDVRAGVFATGAAIGGSWLAGGGGEATWSPAYLHGTVDLGAYRFQGLDGVGAIVWEGRIDAQVPIYRREHEGLHSEVAIGFDGAAGTDRQLATWMRGGIELHVTARRGR